MLTKKALVTAIVTIFYHAAISQGYFTGSDLMEFQLGNLPQLEPKDQFSIYNQLNAGYRYKSFSAQTRFELYYPSFEAESYFRLSQLKLQFISKHIDLQVGNFYTSLGRGLLLRTYEIPGSIWETRGFRVRYAFYKDVLGSALKLNFKRFETKILAGRVLDVTLPPTLEDIKKRRPDLFGGIESSYRIKKQKIGLIYMGHDASSSSGITSETISHYASLYYQGIISKSLHIYSEYGQRIGGTLGSVPFAQNSSFGAYLGMNYFKGSFGLSVELKNYHNFFIGTGINDPPTLVKEHSYRLLNRSTHVPILTDEVGYQVDMYYRLSSGDVLSFNTSLAKNNLSETNQPLFIEFFSEYQFFRGNKSGKFFVDYSSDPFVNEIHRYATGGNVDIGHTKLNSTFEIEWQMINRVTTRDIQFSNWYFLYSLSKASKFAAAVILEITGDPIEIFDGGRYNYFPSTSFSYHFSQKIILNLFFGKRRGGPACNSGVCYDVLSFQGFEARLLARF